MRSRLLFASVALVVLFGGACSTRSRPRYDSGPPPLRDGGTMIPPSDSSVPPRMDGGVIPPGMDGGIPPVRDGGIPPVRDGGRDGGRPRDSGTVFPRDGGLPPIPDASLPFGDASLGTCVTDDDCLPGECCFLGFGLCLPGPFCTP